MLAIAKTRRRMIGHVQAVLPTCRRRATLGSRVACSTALIWQPFNPLMKVEILVGLESIFLLKLNLDLSPSNTTIDLCRFGNHSTH